MPSEPSITLSRLREIVNGKIERWEPSAALSAEDRQEASLVVSVLKEVVYDAQRAVEADACDHSAMRTYGGRVAICPTCDYRELRDPETGNVLRRSP